MMRFRTAFVAICLLAGVVLVTLPVEAAKNHKNFVLYNETGATISAFYFCPSGADSWGPNQLDEPLYDGEWQWNKHNFGQRYYHFRVEFSDGYSFVIENVDLVEVLRVHLLCNDEECWAEYEYE